jgi:hypothetical protein
MLDTKVKFRLKVKNFMQDLKQDPDPEKSLKVRIRIPKNCIKENNFSLIHNTAMDQTKLTTRR